MSPSEINCFFDCRVKWMFGYVQHIRFDIYKRARCIGTVVHDGLAKWYGRESLAKCNKTMALTAKKYGMPKEDLAVCIGIFEHYIVHYASDLDKYELLIIERKVTEAGIFLKCIPDLVLLEKATGLCFIFDHKVKADITDIDKTFDTQKIALYKVISEQYPISGIVFNLIRSKVPMIPEPIIKNTRFKKFAPASTTEAVFRKTLKVYGFEAKDYPEAVEYFATHENTFFRREAVDITVEEMEDFEARFKLAQKEIAGGVIYANRKWDCERQCDYYEMCQVLKEEKGKLVLDKKGWDDK